MRYTPIPGVTPSPVARSTIRDADVRRLYEKAKQLGTWDPAAIDFSQDAEQWPQLNGDERDLLARVVSLFYSGEEAVTRDLLPIAYVVGNERRLDDELFVTAWLFEEGKHTDFFRRFLDEVVGGEAAAGTEHDPLERRLYDEELAAATSRLFTDQTPGAQARAITTYCLIVESLLADTGQRVLREALEKRQVLPGLRAGLVLVNRDESRHVAYGLHFLQRLMRADARVAAVIRGTIEALAPLVIRLADNIMLRYEQRPFDLSYALREPLERLQSQLVRLAPT
jgi:ribonucleoside-diphosphate reductase beta chain